MAIGGFSTILDFLCFSVKIWYNSLKWLRGKRAPVFKEINDDNKEHNRYKRKR